MRVDVGCLGALIALTTLSIGCGSEPDRRASTPRPPSPQADAGASMVADAGDDADAGASVTLDSGAPPIEDAGGPPDLGTSGEGCSEATDCPDPTRQRCNPSTRTCEPAPQWADVRIVYDGGAATRELNTCLFCDATLSSGAHPLLLRFQQGEGRIVWSIYLAEAVTTEGTYPVGGTTSGRSYVFVSETSPMVPNEVRGGYFSTGGTITLSRADIRRGGTVAGTLQIQLEGPSGGTTPAALQGSFFAEIPR